MYDVVIKTGHKDHPKREGPEISQWTVENKFHALNLARKVVVEDGASWAEVAEVKGRFCARVFRENDGTLSGHLSSRRRTHRVKHWGTPNWVSWVAKVALILIISGLLVFGVGKAVLESDELSAVGALVAFIGLSCAAVCIKARKR